MPKVKKNHTYVKSYTSDDLSSALRCLNDPENTKSVYKIAKEHNIPKTTLLVHKKNPEKSDKVGAKPILSDGEEKFLENLIFECQKKGVPRTGIGLRRAAQILIERRPRLMKAKRKDTTIMPGNDCIL